MINIKKVIYDKMVGDTDLMNMVNDVFYKGNNKGANQTQYPSIIYHRITGNSNKIGARKEIFQISIRSESTLTNEDIMKRVAFLFNRTSDPQYKYCSLAPITETYDKDEKVNGTHLTFNFILLDSQF